MNTTDFNALNIHFAPLLANGFFVGALLLTGLLLAVALWRRVGGIGLRLLCVAAFLLMLANPSLVEEKREAVPGIAIAVVDRSASQLTGERMKKTEEALSYLKQKFENSGNIALRVVEAPAEGATARETRLFEALERAVADVPLSRRAGVALITDGQVHDVPATPETLKDYGPIHALLTGRKNERDRRLVIHEAPAYGIVGQNITIRYTIEDPHGRDGQAQITFHQDDSAPFTETVTLNQEQSVSITIGHAGQNIVDITVPPTDNELSIANNRMPLIINGVRDRLRVLLVSGQPHAGGRTWRDLLTSDPGVDLVHFTILREPQKLDFTPQNELSLIAFPFRELFEIKLYDFDLIIFDRYGVNKILPNYYFSNIARYVREGGAFLEASGPSFAAAPTSIYETALGEILPGKPTGQVYEQSFVPTLTARGLNHPVTRRLPWGGVDGQPPTWGPLLRHVDVGVSAGETLMAGVSGKPLLILNRIGQGRVAQLATDQIWLWSRGYEGGGPQAELLRRLAHWLMKEPELDENALSVSVDGHTIVIRRRTLETAEMNIAMTAPNGRTEDIVLKPNSEGDLEARVEAAQLGVYAFDDGVQKRFAIIGDVNPPEYNDLRTTENLLKPVTQASGGNIIWLEDTPAPALRTVRGGSATAGRNALTFRDTQSYQVTGTLQKPLLPDGAFIVLLGGLILMGWLAEGRQKK